MKDDVRLLRCDEKAIKISFWLRVLGRKPVYVQTEEFGFLGPEIFSFFKLIFFQSRPRGMFSLLSFLISFHFHVTVTLILSSKWFSSLLGSLVAKGGILARGTPNRAPTEWWLCQGASGLLL